MNNILILYGSSRPGGNSEILTEKAVEGLECTRIYLRDYRIEAIQDGRHAPEGFPTVNDDYDGLIREVLRHDVLIFSTPLYWYGMSGLMKNFIDRWSQSMREPDLNFSDRMAQKEAYVLITGGDQPKIKGLPLIQQFHWILDFVGARLHRWIIGEGNGPGEVLQDTEALRQAEEWNRLFQSK
jgi:multimeric flavodoxin WrbA